MMSRVWGLLGVLALWQLAVSLHFLPIFVLPSPLGVVSALHNNATLLLTNGLITGAEVAAGLLLGLALVLVAVVALLAGLAAAERLLRPGGRLAVVSFHSLEDRIVKQFLRDASGAVANASRHLPAAAPAAAPTFAQVSKAIRPSEAELLRNPRARSATLRAATRTDAPARERRAA